MIEWSKYFDRIICLSLADNIDKRNDAYADFKRVGIIDSGIFEWKITVKNHFYSLIWSNPSFRTEKFWNDGKHYGNLNCTLGHYEIYLYIKALDYQRVLILEDDCRFLKDINEIEKILDNLPDYDICLFDKYLCADPLLMNNAIENNKINDDYFDYSSCKLWSTACYAINRKFIEYAITRQLCIFSPADHITNKVNNEGLELIPFDLKTICSIKNLAVQDFYEQESEEYYQNCYRYVTDKQLFNIK